jgi:hypothetical protein
MLSSDAYEKGYSEAQMMEAVHVAAAYVVVQV